ncbi:glycosyl transferase [Sinorhizobium fredii USDA 205]|uniref:Glycosyltransferase n=1 Tax=Rhizobium fredii TaxID=380 RepID=A0A844ABR6_RHIFR|nr:glycosyltransferase family 4 protein [Sinorhizobium fredii]ASY72901.1 Glycosyltransferase [Sinorhizobium fredii CCBAU 83666]KSV85912.1 glycosyl transferase [Sinorhizobium fredii USDA 205]MQW97956.1 glycosyltransferase [Sinorhizobium fredii]MQX09522.1 glycosyltransferase [Sinorhizobium fredii]GEC34617.1 glycosyl transferase [Sinorhizobium fredii]
MPEVEKSGKRLLAINNYFYRRGGAEAVFFDHMSMFGEIGWDVVPFAMRHDSNEASPWSDYFVSEIEYGRQTGLFRKAIQAASVIYSLEAQRNIRGLIEHTRPSIAHAHNVYHHLSPAIFSTLKSAAIPVVMTVHDLKLACPSYKMLRDGNVCEDCRDGKIYNVLRHRCVKDSVPLSAVVLAETMLHRLLGLYRDKVDRLVVPSRFYLEKLAEWGWPREKMVHIPNFVDVSTFRTDWQEGDYFVFAGRLAPEKGLATLIRAVALSGERLIVAGTGPEEASLRQLAGELGADVTFAGYLSGEKLHRVIGESRALVLPSEWYENAPISLLETYALQRPVIGAAIGGIPEMVREGETGLLAASGKPEDLARALRAMAAHSPAARRRMGSEGRSWISSEFSAAAYRARTLDLYASLGVA